LFITTYIEKQSCNRRLKKMLKDKRKNAFLNTPTYKKLFTKNKKIRKKAEK